MLLQRGGRPNWYYVAVGIQSSIAGRRQIGGAVNGMTSRARNCRKWSPQRAGFEEQEAMKVAVGN